MSCMSNPAVRRYLVRFAVAMALYAGSLVLSVWYFVHFRPTGPLAWLLAVLPSLPIIGQLAVFGMYLAEEKDEFMRNLQIQSLIWGIGATLSVTVVWGFLESFVRLQHMNLILVYPLYCVLSGISLGVLQLRYR
ncbi:MAG: hypothetical protein ABSB60_16400 [Terracidiphilus sp.]